MLISKAALAAIVVASVALASLATYSIGHHTCPALSTGDAEFYSGRLHRSGSKGY